MYTHEHLMETEGLQNKDLSTRARGYLADFNNFQKGMKMKTAKARKKGKTEDWNETDVSKSHRLSESISRQIIDDLNYEEQLNQVVEPEPEPFVTPEPVIQSDDLQQSEPEQVTEPALASTPPTISDEDDDEEEAYTSSFFF
jgi:hypothetical protein